MDGDHPPGALLPAEAVSWAFRLLLGREAGPEEIEEHRRHPSPEALRSALVPGTYAAPLWLLSHRLWLAFVGYLILMPLLTTGTYLLTRSDDAATIVGIAVALLIGFEASTLRRWTLERNGWRNLGSVVADDLESAEQRFFESWVVGGGLAPVSTQTTIPHAAMSSVGSGDVIGLFPGAAR